MMIEIPIFQIKDANRVYGDLAEKTAFEMNVDPASILGSLAGGYAANHYYQKSKDKQEDAAERAKSIESDAYTQIEAIMKDLKIVFTPINVIYSVKGQVFEIIKRDEMTPDMMAAFQQKDANYYRNLLVNKMNMELQIAQQAFAQRLLMTQGAGQMKQAHYMSRIEELMKVAEDELNGMVKKAGESIASVSGKIPLPITFDSLRPFQKSEIFFNNREFKKVAGLFDLFQAKDHQSIDTDRFNKEVNVGFLPDRVVYLWNGQLVEQLSLLHMNEEGFKAFKNRDKEFFLDFFKNVTKQVSQQPAPTQSASSNTIQPPPFPPSPEPEEEDEEDEGVPKQADALEDIVDEIVAEEYAVMERDELDPFTDYDIHPLVYDAILDDRYGDDWPEADFEALVKQIEIDFALQNGVADNPLNKMMLLHTISSPDHALYQSPLTFEKFVRGMNNKPIQFDEFEGNVTFEEIMFALEIAKSYDGDEVFFEFHDNIAAYVSEELMEMGVRMVSEQLYDEDNPAEQQFFRSVNGYLLRKWKERDTQGMEDDEGIEIRENAAVAIVDIAEDILREHAEKIDIENPYDSLEPLVSGELDSVEPELRTGVKNMVKETILAQYMASIFVEYKHQELEYILERLREDGVIHG